MDDTYTCVQRHYYILRAQGRPESQLGRDSGPVHALDLNRVCEFVVTGLQDSENAPSAGLPWGSYFIVFSDIKECKIHAVVRHGPWPGLQSRRISEALSA